MPIAQKSALILIVGFYFLFLNKIKTTINLAIGSHTCKLKPRNSISTKSGLYE